MLSLCMHGALFFMESIDDSLNGHVNMFPKAVTLTTMRKL